MAERAGVLLELRRGRGIALGTRGDGVDDLWRRRLPISLFAVSARRGVFLRVGLGFGTKRVANGGQWQAARRFIGSRNDDYSDSSACAIAINLDDCDDCQEFVDLLDWKVLEVLMKCDDGV